MEPVYKGKEFKALKLRYEDQTQLLRFLTEFDFKIFTAFFTLQLVLSGWLAANPVHGWLLKIGLLLIDLSLAGISIKLMHNQHRRRQEVVCTIQRLNEALGYTTAGIYLTAQSINPDYTRRYWFNWYLIAIIVSVAGFCFVLFGSAVTQMHSG